MGKIMYSMKREGRGKPKPKQRKLKRAKFGEKSILTLHRKREKEEIKQAREAELKIVSDLTAKIEISVAEAAKRNS